MNFTEEDHIVALRDMLEKFLDEHAPPDRTAAWRQAGQVDPEFWRQAGAAGLLVLCLVSARLASLPARLGAACVLGLAPLVALKLVAPECLGDPFVGLDPLVRAIWLDHVGEVQKLIDLAQTQPTSAITIGVPVALALAATLVAALFSRGLLAARLWLLAALIAAGLAMTFWGVRVFSSVAPLAAVNKPSMSGSMLRDSLAT